MPTIQIQKGSNLNKIASQYGTDVNTLLKLNPGIQDPNMIQAGGNLNIPDSPVAPTINQQAGAGNTGITAPERTLDGAGSSMTEKTLPNVSSQSPLLRFSSVLNEAVSLAKQKRAKLSEETYRGVVPMGALPASSFAGFMQNDRQNSEAFTKPLVEAGISAFKTDEQTIKKNKETIQNIAENVAKSTGNREAVTKILAMNDVEEALTYATPLIKTKQSDGGGEGQKYGPEDLRQLRQAGLASNTDPAVKDFFLNADPQFRYEFIRNYARGVNKNVNIENIGYSYDDWEKQQKAKKSGDMNSQIDNLFSN